MKKKKFIIAILLLVVLFMAGCGTDTSANNQALTRYEESLLTMSKGYNQE